MLFSLSPKKYFQIAESVEYRTKDQQLPQNANVYAICVTFAYCGRFGAAWKAIFDAIQTCIKQGLLKAYHDKSDNSCFRHHTWDSLLLLLLFSSA